MLKIGEFSRLSQVTVKTLHHYDEMGLLKPSLTDPFTNYRYYTLDQLPRLHTIMALKELGLSLEEIARLLTEDLSTEQIRGMYRLKQAELQQRVREEQARLAQVEFRLRQIEQEGIISTLDIVVKRIEPFHALTLRRTFRRARSARSSPGASRRRSNGALSPGRAMCRPPSSMRMSFAGTISIRRWSCLSSRRTPQWSRSATPEHFTLREVPAIETAAVYMHQGDYDSLNEKYLLLQRWAVENGYHLSGMWRFLYHRGPMHQGAPQTISPRFSISSTPHSPTDVKRTHS